MAKKKEVTSMGMTLAVINRMSWGGVNPINERTFLTKILSYFYMFCTGTVVILLGLSFYFTTHANVGAIVKDLIICIGFLQITFKQYTAIQRRFTLGDMVKSAWYDFWSLEFIDEQQKKEIQEIYRKTNIITDIYGYGALAAVYSIIVQSLLTRDRRALVLEIWIPHVEILQITPYYQVIFAAQCVIIVMGVHICVVQLDKLFIVMIALVYVQFKMIKLKILAIGRHPTKLENYELMRQCVIHHNTLLSFVRKFEMVYSRLFLPTVASNILLATVAMWGFMTEEDINSRLSTLFVYITVMSQVLSYCIAGQIIQDEFIASTIDTLATMAINITSISVYNIMAMSLGLAAYECDWINFHDYKIRMGLIMIMKQASRKVELTVGGFMILCMESFGALCRASFSFLAFIVNTQT